MIIDDEPINVTNLQNLIQLHCVDVRIVATASDANSGKEVILQYGPDLVFLDIQMPRKSGFDLLKELSFFDFEIIFVTAHDQYGIQAVKFAAIDYLSRFSNLKSCCKHMDSSGAINHTWSKRP